MNWKGCGRKRSWPNPAFAWRDLETLRKTSIRIVRPRARFEPGTSRIRTRSVNHLTTKFGKSSLNKCRFNLVPSFSRLPDRSNMRIVYYKLLRQCWKQGRTQTRYLYDQGVVCVGYAGDAFPVTRSDSQTEHIQQRVLQNCFRMKFNTDVRNKQLR
jgi:hypothetical protein